MTDLFKRWQVYNCIYASICPRHHSLSWWDFKNVLWCCSFAYQM